MVDRQPLASWNDGAVKSAILDFVARVTKPGGAEFAPPAERIAVFDNDGTLCCEQPLQIQFYFAFIPNLEYVAQVWRAFARAAAESAGFEAPTMSEGASPFTNRSILPCTRPPKRPADGPPSPMSPARRRTVKGGDFSLNYQFPWVLAG
jgi:hypothetical protein